MPVVTAAICVKNQNRIERFDLVECEKVARPRNQVPKRVLAPQAQTGELPKSKFRRSVGADVGLEDLLMEWEEWPMSA